MKIESKRTKDNPNYLGFDEDHNGEWKHFYNCPKCREYNYLTVAFGNCPLCREKLEWFF